MSTSLTHRLLAIGIACTGLLGSAAHAGGGDSQTAFHDFPEVPSGWYATGCCQDAIVAEDVQVAPGTEGMRISEVTVRMLPYNGMNDLELFLYQHDADTGLPGELLGSLELPPVPADDEYVELTFNVWTMGVRVPASGRFWVGFYIDTATGGWNISNANPSMGTSGNFYARKGIEDDVFSLSYPFPPDIEIMNLMLSVNVVPEPCPADVNGDNVVNVLDMIAVILDWGCVGDCAADVNADGIVDVSDLVEVILAWGNCFDV